MPPSMCACPGACLGGPWHIPVCITEQCLHLLPSQVCAPSPPFLTQGLRVRMGIATAQLQEGSALLHSGVLSKAQGEQQSGGGG